MENNKLPLQNPVTRRRTETQGSELQMCVLVVRFPRSFTLIFADLAAQREAILKRLFQRTGKVFLHSCTRAILEN